MNRAIVRAVQRLTGSPGKPQGVNILEKQRRLYSTKPPSLRKKVTNLLALGGSILFFGGASVYMIQQQNRSIQDAGEKKRLFREKELEKAGDSSAATPAAKPAAKPAAPKPKKKKSNVKSGIGGPFELISQDGATVTEKDLLGKWTMVYFGFTHCPDICPEEMEKMSAAVNVISGQRDMPDIPIYFITCDPARDTPEVMKIYNEEISPRIIGLTGPVDKVLDACKQYRVYFSNGPKDRDGDYIVDHSVITYLMDPQGKCQSFYSRDSTVESVARDIRQKITSWTPQS